MSSTFTLTPKEEIELIRQRLVEKYPLINIPEKSYLILMSPRSGSTLLCAHLEEIGFGRPTEGFHFSNRALRERFGNNIDFSSAYDHTVAAINYGTNNGVFGLKFSWVEFEIFLKKAKQLLGDDAKYLSDIDILEIFFPDTKFVRLIRRDKVKQAVSYAKAMQTGIWNERVGTAEDYKQYVIPPRYNQSHIEALFDNLLAFDLSWKKFLNKNNKECLEIWYEDLAKDYVNTMTKVCDFLGVQNIEELQPPLKRQSDALSQKWAERFQQETEWLHDPEITKLLLDGDFEALFFQRSVMMARKHERNVWASLPYHKNKNIKRWIFRAKKRLGFSVDPD
jgi:LPS sulfotransferase NodH